MQHYGIYTRLIDITENLLVGLYFCVTEEERTDGELVVLSVEENELKYTRSDNVSILCSLPPFKANEKYQIMQLSNEDIDKKVFNNNPLIKRLRHEISSEKPFEPEIDPNTLREDFFVIPTRDNRRIIQQSGSFIICCLNYSSHGNLNKYRFANFNKKNIFVIPYSIKNKIKEELELYGIDQISVYPEIETVSKSLVLKYSSKD